MKSIDIYVKVKKDTVTLKKPIKIDAYDKVQVIKEVGIYDFNGFRVWVISDKKDKIK